MAWRPTLCVASFIIRVGWTDVLTGSKVQTKRVGSR